MASTASIGAGDLDTPAWVVNVREEISRSPAWEVLSDQLYDRVSIVLKSHGLGHFSDLCSAEQVTLLEEAHREIMSEDNKVYQVFESQFSKFMDTEIAKEARARVEQDETAKRGGTDEVLYLDRILDSAAEGAVSLLRELPREHLGSLRLMLNQPVPSRARLDIWRLLLKHTAAREEYELLMKRNRNSTISGLDIYITHRCQALLESGPVASRRLLPLTSRNVVLMKTVLSYHHACKMNNSSNKRGEKATTGDVPESFVHFLVPLCAVVTRGAASFSTSISSNAAAAAAAATSQKTETIEVMIEGLVEMFEAALEAGLVGLVDPKELTGSGGGGGGGGSILAVEKTARMLKAAQGKELPGNDSGKGDGGGNGDQVGFPAWVDKAHDVLVPGFQGLVDHVARVHLGLAVEVLPVAKASVASEGDEATEHKKGGDNDDNDNDSGNGNDSNTAGAATGRSSSSTPSESEAAVTVQGELHQREKKEQDEQQQEGADDDTRHTLSSPADNTTATSSTNRSRSSSSSSNNNNRGDPSAPRPNVSASQARAALCALLKPLVTVGLVGHLSADACLFAWDQAVVAGFGVMIPRVAAMVVVAAADKLEACVTFAVMSEALLSHAHLVSTSQLQELMEARCMPAIREETRVSHKLSPEIVGPSLRTATEILDSAYSKRTKEIQEARKAHVDHASDPSAKGAPGNRKSNNNNNNNNSNNQDNNGRNSANSKNRLQIDLSRTSAEGPSGGSGSSSGSNSSNSSNSGSGGGGGIGGHRYDDVSSDFGEYNKERGDGGGRDKRNGHGDGDGDGTSGGAKEKYKNKSKAEEHPSWRDALSHRSASSSEGTSDDGDVGRKTTKSSVRCGDDKGDDDISGGSHDEDGDGTGRHHRGRKDPRKTANKEEAAAMPTGDSSAAAAATARSPASKKPAHKKKTTTTAVAKRTKASKGVGTGKNPHQDTDIEERSMSVGHSKESLEERKMDKTSSSSTKKVVETTPGVGGGEGKKKTVGSKAKRAPSAKTGAKKTPPELTGSQMVDKSRKSSKPSHARSGSGHRGTRVGDIGSEKKESTSNTRGEAAGSGGSPAASSTATAPPASPLRRWLGGFGGGKKKATVPAKEEGT